MKKLISICILLGLLYFMAGYCTADSVGEPGLELIRPSKDGTHFITGLDDRFVAWGFNYDHDPSGRLIEDYWQKDWDTVVNDFKEMKDLGANMTRIHLQLPKFMKSAESVDESTLAQLTRLIALAEGLGLYLDITGLGCYHRQDVPEWYDAMNESDRWTVQCRFWEEIAKNCAASPAIFCYDLMNEPILPGGNKKETEWLSGELGGKHFVQRITLDLAGRTRIQVAKAWVDKLTAAIRKHDKIHMITVGVIPWAYSFPGAKPLFYSDEVGQNLDFVSVHFYPKKNDTRNALKALEVYNVGKPILIEETFPLQCSIDELNSFIDGSRKFADGWLGFYWGNSIGDYGKRDKLDLAGAITKAWLEYFKTKGSGIIVKPPPGIQVRD